MRTEKKLHGSIGKAELIFLVLFLSVMAFNIWKAPYGEVWDDEAFYLTVPYRMWQGDSFLVHEWSMGQMFGFILLPLVRLYISVFGSTDGIYLAFRYMYVVTHTLTSLYVFLRLRKINFAAAASASLIYYIFSYGNLMTLNYNTMGIGFMLICWLTIALSRGKAWEYMIAGLCFAISVLCSPFLLILYAVYTIAAVCFLLHKGEPNDVQKVLSMKGWTHFTLMCALLAAAFFGRLIISGDLHMIFRTLPELLQEDYHVHYGPLGVIKDFILTFDKYNGLFWPVLAGSIVLCLFIAKDPDCKKHRTLYLFAAAALAGMFSATYVLLNRITNFFLFPLHILGFFAYLLCEKKNRRLFWLLYVPGCIYWFAVNMASNLGLMAISGVSAVNLPASMVFVFDLLGELRGEEESLQKRPLLISRLSRLAAMGLIVVCAGSMFISRAEQAVFADPIGALTERIDVGAAKGVICTPQQKELYEGEYAALCALREIEDGKVLYFERNSIRHIEDLKVNAHHNMWFAYEKIENAEAKLKTFWEIIPERRPDYIYLNEEKSNDPEIYNMFCTAFDYDYSITELEHGVIFVVDWH